MHTEYYGKSKEIRIQSSSCLKGKIHRYANPDMNLEPASKGDGHAPFVVKIMKIGSVALKPRP